MARIPDEIGGLLRGPLLETSDWPLILSAELCDLRPRFIPKGRIGHSHHAVARNGRVLLVADRPLTDLIGRVVGMRLQTWHKVFLAGQSPEPWGILWCARGIDLPANGPLCRAWLMDGEQASPDLSLAVGGAMNLSFQRAAR